MTNPQQPHDDVTAHRAAANQEFAALCELVNVAACRVRATLDAIDPMETWAHVALQIDEELGPHMDSDLLLGALAASIVLLAQCQKRKHSNDQRPPRRDDMKQ